MRAKEFILEKRTDELAPVIGAVGGALKKGAQAVGGAAMNAVKQGATNLAIAGAKKLANTQLGQAAIGAVANAAGAEAPKPGEAGSGQSAVGTSGPGEPVQKTQGAAGTTQQQAQQQAQQNQSVQNAVKETIEKYYMKK